MNSLTSLSLHVNRPIENSNFERDPAKIKEVLLNINSNAYLTQCPSLIQNLCSIVESKHSLDSIKSLFIRAFATGETRIEENFRELINIYEKDPLCRVVNLFLKQYHSEILQLLEYPEQIEAKFNFFEQQSQLSPLIPFFKKIRKEFEACSKLPRHLFQNRFEIEVYTIVLTPLVKRGHKNFIHASGGHCKGSMISQAVPLKGMSAAFIHTCYHLSIFFNVFYDRKITSNFGKKYLNTEVKMLLEHLPTTFLAISRILATLPKPYSNLEFATTELIGRIASARFFLNNNCVKKERSIILGVFKPDFDLKLKHRESFRIIGQYILKHRDEFIATLPETFNLNTPCEDIGEWAYNLTIDFTQDQQPNWDLLHRMFGYVDRNVNIYNLIERRGLKFVELVNFHKPFKDFESQFTTVNFEDGDHYDIGIDFDGQLHALSLKFKNNLFIFSDPNFYHPITYNPIEQSFESKQECFSFIQIFISYWYLGEIFFSLTKYSEIATFTPQMREYQFGQNLAARNSLISEITQLDNWCTDLKDRLLTVESKDEYEKINAKIGIVKSKMESIQKELYQFQLVNKKYLEATILSYEEKNRIKPSKSYTFVIQSLRSLLPPTYA